MIGLLLISRMINQFKFISSSRLSRWTNVCNPCLLCPPAKPRRTNKLKLTGESPDSVWLKSGESPDSV